MKIKLWSMPKIDFEKYGSHEVAICANMRFYTHNTDRDSEFLFIETGTSHIKMPCPTNFKVFVNEWVVSWVKFNFLPIILPEQEYDYNTGAYYEKYEFHKLNTNLIIEEIKE